MDTSESSKRIFNPREVASFWLKAGQQERDIQDLPEASSFISVTLRTNRLEFVLSTGEEFTIQDSEPVSTAVSYKRMNDTLLHIELTTPGIKVDHAFASRLSMQGGYRLLGFRSSDQLVPLS